MAKKEFDEIVKKHLSKVEVISTFDQIVKKHLSKIEIVRKKGK